MNAFIALTLFKKRKKTLFQTSSRNKFVVNNLIQSTNRDLKLDTLEYREKYILAH